jgi:hypothetical protein
MDLLVAKQLHHTCHPNPSTYMWIIQEHTQAAWPGRPCQAWWTMQTLHLEVKDLQQQPDQQQNADHIRGPHPPLQAVLNT